MIDLSKLLQPAYWFNPTPPSETTFVFFVLIFFLLQIIVSIIIWIILSKRAKKIKPYQKLKDKLFTPLLTCGILGIVLLFFRWQSIPYLSSRILLFALIISFFIWGIITLIYCFVGFKKDLNRFFQKKQYEKYLPKKKGNKN